MIDLNDYSMEYAYLDALCEENKKELSPYLNEFKCSRFQTGEDFIRTEAISHLELNGYKTFLVRDHTSDKIHAYFVLKCSSVILDLCNKQEAYPTIEISYFVVDDTITRHNEVEKISGFGNAVFIDFICPLINSIKHIIGVKLISLFAIDIDKVHEAYVH